MRQLNNTKDPGGIVLYSPEKELDLDKLKHYINLRMGWYSNIDIDIMIILNDRIVRILKYKL